MCVYIDAYKYIYLGCYNSSLISVKLYSISLAELSFFMSSLSVSNVVTSVFFCLLFALYIYFHPLIYNLSIFYV